MLVSQHDDPTSDGCSIVNMGAIQVAHDPEPGHLAQQQRLLQQLQQHVMRQDRLSSQDLQQLLTQVRHDNAGLTVAVVPACCAAIVLCCAVLAVLHCVKLYTSVRLSPYP